VASLARIALEGGGSILVEAPVVVDGPVKAGRVGDAIHDLPATLQTALEPLTAAGQAILDQLRKAGPSEVMVEFGVDLALQAGVVITKSETACHMKVTLIWKNGSSE
jgi:hypothetical protein